MPGQIDPNLGAEYVTSPQVSYKNVPIPAGASGISGDVDLGPYRLGGIAIPSSWITATSITFQASADGTNWYNLFDEVGTEISIGVAASRLARLSLADWLSLRWLRLRSGTSGAPVNQTNSPVLTLILVA